MRLPRRYAYRSDKKEVPRNDILVVGSWYLVLKVFGL